MLIDKYMDRVEYKVRTVEVSWRYGSIEVNESKAYARGVRVFDKGKWSIVSEQSEKVDYRVLESRALRLLRITKPMEYARLLDDERCSGARTLGEGIGGVDDLIDIVEFISKEMRRGELIVLYEQVNRVLDDGSTRCVEEKHVYEITLFYEAVVDGKRSVGSSSIAYTGSLRDLDERMLKSIIAEAKARAEHGARAKRLSPLEAGKTTIILGYEASATFFHELAHMLEADIPGHLNVGQRISTTSISIRDDPFYPWSPTSTFFDDEGIVTRRRQLVEDGEVISLLHTRATAAKALELGSEAYPGSSKGLFHIPKAMHTTLVVEPGDWREKEIVEETRKGLIIDGVIRADIHEGMITIVPEVSWRIEHGEIVEPVSIRRVRLPLFRALTTIDAIGRSLRLRHSVEKGYRVAEVSPIIRLEGYVDF